MENVVKMRRYRTAELSTSQFLPSNTPINTAFALDDLSKSGLVPDDMEIDVGGGIYRVDNAIAAYVIPYYDLKGNPLVDGERRLTMYRTKMGYPKGVNGQRYSSPSGEVLAKYGLPTSIPYVPPSIHAMNGKEIICAEGEKKCAAIVKLLQLPAFGIGGCQMWRDPDGSGRPHPWILELLRARDSNTIIIVPDGDIARYDISTAYGTFSRALEYEGFTVQILHPPGKIDDLLVAWGDSRVGNWAEIPKRSPADLVQSPKSLISRYSLSFKTDAKGNPTVHQHTSNIMRLMGEHPAFPKVWLNQDNAQVMIGDTPAEPHRTEMDIANYFQYNLGMEKVNDRVIHNCVMSLARTNKRSPFLDWVRSLDWDGVPRLDRWLTEYWGVEDTEYTREVGSKWMVSACARLDKPGTKIDWMLIVVGPQATGKTSMPGILFKDSSLTLYGEHNDKDLHLLMHSKLCVGFDELDSFGRREASNLKAMITRNEDAFRPPYGMSVEVFPRRFTLYGCGNRYEFLQHDPSGYRRYAVIEVTRLLDFARLEADKGQIWAEAWQRYQTGGVEYWMVEGAALEAEKYAVPNVIEEMIVNYIETERMAKQATTCKDGFIWLQMPTILHRLDMEKEIKNTNITREISGILRKLGAVNFQGSGPMGKRGRWYKVALE
jgi:Virulence-associated protein E-like domain